MTLGTLTSLVEAQLASQGLLDAKRSPTGLGIPKLGSISGRTSLFKKRGVPNA